MGTILTESKIEKPTCLGTDMKEAAKRVEKGLNDSKAAVSAKLEDGRIAAERFLKHSRYAVEDGIEDASHQIKRNPLGSLAIAFAAGAALAFLVPHLGGRKTGPSQ
jgi:hypothetical protein